MPTRARVVILEGDYDVAAIREIELPDPGPGEVAVLIYAAGVTWAELHEVGKSRSKPTVLGTEGSGRVTAVGEGVTDLAVGNFVIIGNDLLGDQQIYLPVVLDDGTETFGAGLYTWATNVVVDASQVLALGAPADREAAAAAGTTVRYALSAIEAAAVDEGHTVVVFGVAAVGLAIVALAAAAGATTIVAVDRNAARLEKATGLGATHVVTGSPEQALAGVAAILPTGANAAFDCLYDYRAKKRPGRRTVGEHGHAFLLAMNGTVADAEAFEATVDEYGYERIMQRCDASSLADVLTRGVVNPAAIVTARYTIEGVNEALRDLENGTVVGAAVLVMEPLT